MSVRDSFINKLILVIDKMRKYAIIIGTLTYTKDTNYIKDNLHKRLHICLSNYEFT